MKISIPTITNEAELLIIDYIQEIEDVIDVYVNEAVTTKSSITVKNIIQAICNDTNVDYTKVNYLISKYGTRYGNRNVSPFVIVKGVIMKFACYNNIKSKSIKKLQCHNNINMLKVYL